MTLRPTTPILPLPLPLATGPLVAAVAFTLLPLTGRRT